MYEGWFRSLLNDRLEIFLKAKGVKVRASGPEQQMFELVDWFEAKTDLRVESPRWRRVRTGPRPMAGQLEISELTSAVEQEALT